MSKEMREEIDKIKNFGEFLYENTNGGIIGYHISEENFDNFNSSEHIGNFGTILDDSYFLSTKDGLSNFGSSGIIYTVEIKPKHIFRFDLRTNDHWYLTTEFQELFSESIAGISNYLDDFFEEENVVADNVDCIILTNLDYLSNKDTKEYIVLDENIITILKKENFN